MVPEPSKQGYISGYEIQQSPLNLNSCAKLVACDFGSSVQPSAAFSEKRLLELLRSSKPRRESLQEKVFAALETGWKGKGKESFCPGNRVESMAAKRGRGGARHTPKPFTDEAVLFKVLADKELVKDLVDLVRWTQRVWFATWTWSGTS